VRLLLSLSARFHDNTIHQTEKDGNNDDHHDDDHDALLQFVSLLSL